MSIEYTHQYYKLYQSRLEYLSPLIRSKIPQAVDSLSRIQTTDCEVYFIGVLFIVSGCKPSIFDELSLHGKEEHTDTYYTSDMKYFVEDSTCHVEITVQCADILSSGMVLGFKGVKSNGSITVSDIIYPCTITPTSNILNRVCVLSDIQVDITLSELHVLFNYIKDRVDSVYLIGPIFNNITESNCRLLIENIHKVLSIISNISIFIIPELGDIGTDILPYIDLHNFIRFNTAQYLCNPTISNNILILPQCTVIDILRYKYNDNALINKNFSDYRSERVHINIKREYSTEEYKEAVQQIIKCGHCAPTAPDTLRCTSYSGKDDPFILKDTPHTILVGKSDTQPGHVETFEGIALIVCPSFAKRGECIIITEGRSETVRINIE